MGRRLRKKMRMKVTRHQRVYRTVKVVKMVLQCERPYVLFGEAVKAARADIAMTQQELADKLGYSRGSIANIEVGRQRINLGDVIAFARCLKTEPLKLFRAALR